MSALHKKKLQEKHHHLLAGGGIFILLNSMSEMIEGKVDLTAFVKHHPSSITKRQFMLREKQVASQNYFGSASNP